MSFPRVTKLKTAADFQSRQDELGINIPFDETVLPSEETSLGRGFEFHRKQVGNRFCILPMEGWDGTEDGKPTDLTIRRWKNFGASGAKLIWGGEAVAVRHDGRANPNQLVMNEANLSSLEELRQVLNNTHQEHFGSTDDLYVGLQLTHSGRFARPNDKGRIEPRTIYRHPILDKRFDVDSEKAIFSDSELKQLIDDFVGQAHE